MAKPTYLSAIPDGTDVSVADVGVALQGLSLYEQGYNVAGVLEALDLDGAPLYPTCVVQKPRRATKTTSIWSVLLGRCETRPGTKVVTTAQDGQRARNRWREVARAMDARGWEDTPGNKIRWSNGDEAFEWANGSRLWVVPPNAGAFRSEAADVLLFDEAGELSADKSEDLMSGALPLLDTRPMGQAIIAGTPGKVRAGLLWDHLVQGRAGEPGIGIVDYSARDDESPVIIAADGTVTLNEDLLLRVHPGIGTLTTLAKMRQRFSRMQVPQFAREYLCQWPTDNGTDAIDPAKWIKARGKVLARPSRVGIAFDCAYDGSSATIAYAWRNSRGHAVIEVVAHQTSTSWVAREARKASQSYGNRVPVAYDGIGANEDPAASLRRYTKPTPKVDRLDTKQIMGAAQRLSNEISEGRLRHFGQPDLDEAVANATWRDIAKSGRAFGTKNPAGSSINPLVAASLALWSYDKGKDRERITISA